jgi:hypothetical protein
MSRILSMLLVIMGCISFAVPASGQNAPKAVKHPSFMIAALDTDDDAKADEAIAAFHYFVDDPRNTKTMLERVSGCCEAALKHGRFHHVEDMAITGICALPHDLVLVQRCQELRIRAKLLAGKSQEALPLAKSLYNVSSMQNTSKAIELIAECLYDINQKSGPAEVVRKFKMQQVAGATLSAEYKPIEGNILNTIKVDPSAYDAGLKRAQLDGASFQSLMGQGNMLLLSDKPKEAHQIMEKAYSLALDQNLADATEAVARAMRAEDGTVGRANNWILSLQTGAPKKE